MYVPKKRTTTKFIKAMYRNIYTVPYCALQNTLSGKDPVYYNAGVYGWNYDCYQIDLDTVILTGYRIPVKGCVKIPWDACEKAEQKVKEALRQNPDTFFDEMNNIITDLLQSV